MPSLTSDVVAAGTFGSGAQPTIPTGSGLVLRPWTPSDAPAVFEAFADPEIRRWHVRAASSRDEVETWIDSWVADWPGGAQAHWAVADSHTNELVGRASLKNIELVSGQGEVAYWTMPDRRRQRVASRAVGALTRWAFGEVGFHRLELTHSVHNSSSCRVAVRTGSIWREPNAARVFTSTDGTTCTCTPESATTNVMGNNIIEVQPTTIDHDAAIVRLLSLAAGGGQQRLQHVVQRYSPLTVTCRRGCRPKVVRLRRVVKSRASHNQPRPPWWCPCLVKNWRSSV
jgi:RimJ/RimL family protein N-acetyltransferase